MSVELHLQNITKTFIKDGVKFDAVEKVDLKINGGELLTFLGPSGCGKTTTLRMVAGFETPTSGSIFIDGRDVTNVMVNKREIGFVFQFHHLLPAFSALENVTLPALMSEGRVSSGQRERARSLLEAVGLARAMEKRPNELSGGMQQRVAIARALVMEPPLVLADEPTGNLDTSSSDEVFSLLRRIHDERGTAFIVVTHDPRLARRCDRVVELVDGRIAQDRHYEAAESQP